MRVISLVPSITEALCQLGCAKDLVGITDYCIHPEEVVGTKTRIGGTKDPDLAQIRDLRPDLVIANTDEQRKETLDALGSGPFDLLVTQTDSLLQVEETWTRLGQVLGQEENAERERHRLEVAIEAARTHVDGLDRLGVLVPIWKRPWMAAGGGTYLGDLLETCGFDNILGVLDQKWVRFEPTLDHAEAQRHVQTKGPFKDQPVVSLPRLPESVLLPTEPYAFEDSDRDTFTTLEIPRERVVIVDGELLTWWLSRSVDALAAFSHLHDRLVAATTTPP